MTATKKGILPIGTKVKIRLDNGTYNSKEGVIVEVRRGFKEFDEWSGSFVSDGLLTMEDTIKHIAVPYDFDGKTLKVHFPGHKVAHSFVQGYTKTSKYYRSYYTVRVLDLDCLVVLSSDSLIVLSKPSDLEQRVIAQLIEHRQNTVNSKILKGITYAYDVTAYRKLLTISDEQWMNKDFSSTQDKGFVLIFESEIVLTHTEFNELEPIAVFTFGTA